MNIPGLNGTLRDVIQAIRELAVGGSNATGSLVLKAGATVTTVTDDRAALGCKVFLTATSAAAAATPRWVSGTANGAFTLAHPAAPAGCTFDYLILH